MATTLAFDIVARDLASRVFANVGRRSGILSRTLGGFGNIAAGALKGAGLALTGFGIAAAKTGLQTAALLQRAETSFQGFGQSAAEAGKLVDDLVNFTLKTPFELPGLVAASVRLQGVGVEANKVIPTLTALGDTAAQFGLNTEQFERVLLAMTQSLAKGRFQQEEFNQVSEAGIPILGVLSRALGKPIPELLKLSRQGDLLAKDVFPALLTQMQKDYGGAMAKQVANLTGGWSNLIDAFKIGASDAIQPLVPLLSAALPRAAAATIERFRALRGVVQALVDNLGPPLSAFIGFLRTTALPAIGDFARAMVGLIPVDDIGKSLQQASRAITDFFNSLSGSSAPSASDLMEHIWDPSEASKLGAQIRNALQGGLGDAIDGINWNKLGENIGRGLGIALGWLAEHTADITRKIGAAFEGIDWVNVGKSVGGKAVGFAIGFVAGLGTELFSAEFWKKHFWDVILAVIGITGVGKLAGGLAKIVAKIPILKAFAPLLQGINRLTGPVQTAVFGVVRAAGRALSFLGRELLTGIGNAFGRVNLGQQVARWLSAIPTGIGVARINIVKKASEMIRAFAGAITRASGAVTRAIGRLIGLILRPFARAGSWLVQRGSQIIGGLVRGISTNLGRRIGAPLRRARSSIIGAFRSAGSWLRGAGARIISGLISGIRSRARAAVNAARGVVSNAIRAAKNLLGIRSPSKVFMEIGTDTTGGLIEGLKRGMPDVQASLKNLTDGVGVNVSPQAFGVPTGTSGGPVVINLNISGPVGSQYELRNWLARSIDDLNRQGRLSGISAS